jgi:hypothetical protein
VAQARLDEVGEDTVCASIADGRSLTSIASEAGVSIGTLLTWFAANTERSARVAEARRVTSWHWDELAEKEIRDAPPTSEGIAKARELASHFRWRASKIDIRYGDKTQLQNLDKNGNPTDAPQRVQIEIVGGPPAQIANEPQQARIARSPVIDIDIVGNG